MKLAVNIVLSLVFLFALVTTSLPLIAGACECGEVSERMPFPDILPEERGQMWNKVYRSAVLSSTCGSDTHHGITLCKGSCVYKKSFVNYIVGEFENGVLYWFLDNYIDEYGTEEEPCSMEIVE